MNLVFHQIDAFASEVFTGNPAAVCLTDQWLDDALMQKIAMENNLAETAYLVREADNGPGQYGLRWFTPTTEVDLCGHATLASAHCLWTHHGEDATVLTFHTRSGALIVKRDAEGLIEMDFPANPVSASSDSELGQKMLGAEVQEVFISGSYAFLVLKNEAALMAVEKSQVDYRPALDLGLKEALVMTAPADEGTGRDCVSRFFAPYAGIPEDPVTGSIHTSIVPYWAQRLGKSDIVAYQASPRGGTLFCHDTDTRVILRGRCTDYCRAEISL